MNKIASSDSDSWSLKTKTFRQCDVVGPADTGVAKHCIAIIFARIRSNCSPSNTRSLYAQQQCCEISRQLRSTTVLWDLKTVTINNSVVRSQDSYAQQQCCEISRQLRSTTVLWDLKTVTLNNSAVRSQDSYAQQQCCEISRQLRSTTVLWDLKTVTLNNSAVRYQDSYAQQQCCEISRQLHSWQTFSRLFFFWHRISFQLPQQPDNGRHIEPGEYFPQYQTSFLRDSSNIIFRHSLYPFLQKYYIPFRTVS